MNQPPIRGPKRIWRLSWSNAPLPGETNGCILYSEELYFRRKLERLKAQGASCHVETTLTNWELMDA